MNTRLSTFTGLAVLGAASFLVCSTALISAAFPGPKTPPDVAAEITHEVSNYVAWSSTGLAAGGEGGR